MKGIIVVAVFMTCMALGHCRLCEKAEDCKDNECCVASTFSQIRGRGFCRRLGRLGSYCNLDGVTLDKFGGKYLSRCPCTSDYSCEPPARYRNRSRNEVFTYLVQRCRRPSTVTKDNKGTTSSITTDVSVTSSSSTDGSNIDVTSTVGSSTDGSNIEVTSTVGSSTDGSNIDVTSTDDSSTEVSTDSSSTEAPSTVS